MPPHSRFLKTKETHVDIMGPQESQDEVFIMHTTIDSRHDTDGMLSMRQSMLTSSVLHKPETEYTLNFVYAKFSYNMKEPVHIYTYL